MKRKSLKHKGETMVTNNIPLVSLILMVSVLEAD